MALDRGFQRLIEVSAPLWAGEAEVVRSYFEGAGRTRETDRRWLACQCHKEFWGSGFAAPEVGLIGEWGREILAKLPRLDIDVDRHELLDQVEQMYAEFHHYCMFADIYDSLSQPGEPRLNPGALQSWPEGDALDRFRIDMRAREGELGAAALRFTEGGYCTLYSEGAKLEGRGGIDGTIGAACRKVYDDEFEHLIRGIAAVNDTPRSAAEWDRLEELSVAQLRLRVHMRNGQFSHPLSAARIDAIFHGDIAPLAFDYRKARLVA